MGNYKNYKKKREEASFQVFATFLIIYTMAKYGIIHFICNINLNLQLALEWDFSQPIHVMSILVITWSGDIATGNFMAHVTMSLSDSLK